MHPALDAVAEDTGADAHCSTDRRLVPALHAAGRLDRARRLAARHRRLRASLRRRGGAGRRSRRARSQRAGFACTRRHRRHHRRRLRRRALWRDGLASRQRRGAQPACAAAARRAAACRAETVAALARVGLKRIGDIIDLPRAPLAARFGGDCCASSTARWAASTSRSMPRLPVAPYVAEQRFRRADRARGGRARASPNGWRRGWQFALERRGDGARRIELDIIPHRRRGAPHRRRHVAADARSRGRSARCSSSGWPRSPTSSIPASASTWRGCRCWSRKRCPPEQIGIGGGDDEAELDRAGRPSERAAWARRACAG